MAKVEKNNTVDPIVWYSENKNLFEQLSKKVESILKEIIADNSLAIHGIYSRSKEVDSFKEKIQDAKYKDPINQITDFAGIRIITYVESDLDKISKLVEENFIIDNENSVDKTKSLGIDKVGYRSVHYVAKLPENRTILAEYKKFFDLSFEIQIRTILQHAWAEIEHDKDYKFSGELPSHIKRRFKVLSGVLELADREFNLLATEIDNYQVEINEDTQSGNLNIEINSASVEAYMKNKFSKLYDEGKIDYTDTKELISELRNFDLNNIQELDNILEDSLIEKILSSQDSNNTIAGILRSAMMNNNLEKYFSQAWKEEHWKMITFDAYQLLKSENLPIDEYMQKYNLKLSPI